MKFQIKQDTSGRWSQINPILELGEFGLDTTLMKFKIGDGILTWKQLPYDDNSIWNEYKYYQMSELCINDGLLYIALQNNLNKEPSTFTTYWKEYTPSTTYTKTEVDNLIKTIHGGAADTQY